MAGSPPVTAPVDPNEAFAAAAGPPPGANLPGGGPPTSAQVARAKPAATPVRPGSVGAAPDPNEAFAAAAGPPPGSGAQTTPIPQPGVEWSGHAPGPFPGMPTPPGQAQPYTFNGRQQPGPGVSGGRGFFFGDQQQQPGIAGQQQPGAEPHYTPTFVPPPGPPLPIDATPRAMQAQLSQEHQYIDIERKNLDQLAALGKQGKLSGQESVDYSARSQALSQRVTNYQALYAQYQQLPSAHIRPIAPHQYQQPPQLAALANAQAALKAAPDVLSPATFLALRQNVGLAWGPVTQTWAQRTARLNADAKDIDGAWAELKPLIAQDQKGELSPASHASLIRSARQLTMNQMAHDGMVDQQTQEIQAFTKWQKAHGDAPVHLGMAYPQEVANPRDPGLVRRTIDSISGVAARLLTPNDVAAQKNVPAARNALMLAGAYPPLPPLGQGPPAEIASLIRQKNDLVTLVQAEKNGVTLPTHTLTQFQQNLLPTIRMQVDAEARAQQMAGTAGAFKADASALLVGALLGEIGAGLGGGLAARFIPRLLARGESGPLAAATARILARTTATTAGWGLGGPGGAGVSAYVMGPPPNYDPRTGKKIGGPPTTGQRVQYGIEQAGRAVVPSLEMGAGVGLVGGVAGEIAAAAKTGFGRIYGWRPAPPAPGGTTVTPVATPALGPGEVDLGGGATYQPPPPETGPQAGPRFYDPKTGGIVESEGPVGNGTRLRVIDPGNAAGMGERTGRRWIALKGQMKDLQPLTQGETPPAPTHTVYQNRLIPNISIPAAGEPGVGGVGPDGEPQGAGVPKSFLGVPQEPGGSGTQIPGTRPVSPGMGSHVIVISPQGVDVDLRTRPLGDLQDFLSQYGAAHAQNGLTPEQQADYARTQKFLDAQNAYIRQQAAAPVTPEVSAAVTQALTKGGAERTNDLFALRRGIGEADRARDPRVQDALHDAVREQTGLIVQDANQRLAPEAGTAPDQLVPPVRASAYRQLDPDQFAGLPPATRRALLLQDINNSRHVLDPAAPTLFSLPTGVRSESGLSGLADQLYQAAGLHLAAMFPAPIGIPEGTTPGSATGLGTPAQPGLGGVPSAVPPPATPTSTATSPPGAPPSPVTPTPATGAAPSTSAPPTTLPTTGTTGGGNASGTLPITGSNLATPGAGAVTPSVPPAGRPPTVSPARPPASTTLPAISAASLPALTKADLKPGVIVQMVSNEALYGLIERAEQKGKPAWAVHIEDEPGSRTFGQERGRILEARLLQPGAFVLAQAAPGAEPSASATPPPTQSAPTGLTTPPVASTEPPPSSSERTSETAASETSRTPPSKPSPGSAPAPSGTEPPPVASVSPIESKPSRPTATLEPKEPDLYPDDVKPGALLHNPLVGDVVRVLTTRRDRTLPGDQLDQAEIEYLQVPHPDGIQRGDRRWVTLQHLLDHYAPYAPTAGGLLPAEAPETTQRVVSAPGPAPENLLPETLRMLIDAITDRVTTAMERGEPIFKNNIELETLAGSILGGSRAQGTYSAQTVYNALEAGVNRWVVAQDFGQQTLEEGLARTAALLAALPTQSLRSGDKDALQQFSTPPSYAMLAAYALRAREGDSLLEPSAGTGSLLSMAMSLYGPELKERVANEIDPERRAILHDYFTHDTYGVDARYLNSTLPHGLTFDLILMNPPFSSAPGQRAANTNEIGFDHVKQALKRLRPGGRLVALLGRGASFERPTSGPFWRPVMENYHVIANMSLPGKDYEKYGTGFETQFVIIDNTGPTPDYGAVLTTGAKSAVEAGGLLNEHGAFERTVGPGVNAEVGPGPAAAPGTGGAAITGAPGGGRVVRGRGRPGGREVLAPAAEPAGAGGTVPERVPGNTPGTSGEPGEQPGSGAAAPVAVRAPAEGPGEEQPAGHVEPVAAPAKRGRPKKQTAVMEPEVRTDVGTQYVSYLPAYVIEGRPHPAVMVETRSLAAVDPPPITVTHHLREEALYPTPALAADFAQRMGKATPNPEDMGLSHLQLEAMLYAKQRHNVILPDGARAGFLLGDSTGAGKGRTGAAIIGDAWESGTRRMVWFSGRGGLLNAAKDDLAQIGYGHIPVMLINDVGASQHIPDSFEGVIFSTYNSLLGKGTQGGPLQGQLRRIQIEHWLNGTNVEKRKATQGEGSLVIFDESHRLKSAAATKGGPASAKYALEGVRLQNNLPLMRVVYSSATAMTEMQNMGYLVRLGLWGKGTPWPRFDQFAAEFGKSPGKMEMVARDMKARGMYLSREISFRDPQNRPEQSVEFRTLTHKLSAADQRKYNLVAQAWQTALQNFEAAIEITGGGKDARRSAYSAFWSSHQRFFRSFLTALKLPTLYADIDEQLAAGKSVILSLTDTREAVEERAVREGAAEGIPLDELDLTPIKALIRLVDRAFPTQTHVEELSPDGQTTVMIPLFDANGEPVHNPEALARKEELMGRLGNISESLPGNPLNEILWRYGHGNVAEISGRDKRLEPGPNGETVRVSRGGGNINELEMTRFNGGEKRIAIITPAANEGISLQAGRRFVNQQRRAQYMVQLNFAADQQMQANGRSHRSNQVSAPQLVIVNTDAGGEVRFAATIARRLASLGALTRGEREATGAGGMLDQFDYENDYGRQALEMFYRGILAGRAVPGLADPRQALRDMGLLVIPDPRNGFETIRDEDVVKITRFMNRLLALEVERQNPLFEQFSQIFRAIVDAAMTSPDYDFGVQDIRGQNLREAAPPQVVHTDPTTGAQTTYHHIVSDEPTKPARLEMIDKLPEAQRAGFHQRNSDGTLFYVARTQSTAYPFHLMKPDNIQAGRITPTEMAESYTPVRTEEGTARARTLWAEEEAAIPATTPHHYHLVAGSVLPVYDRLRSARQVNFDVKRATLPGNQRVVGISLAPNSYRAILRALGASAGGIDPADLFRELMQTGAEFPLVSGLSLKRSTRSGRPALMIQGAEYDLVKELQREMGTGERVNYNELVWVPSSPTEGPKKLAALLERFPPMAGAEGTTAVAVGAPPPIARGLLQLQPQQTALLKPARWVLPFATQRWLEAHAPALSEVFREAGRLGLTDEEQARAHDYGILLWPEIDNGKGKQPSFLAGMSRGQGLEGLQQEGQLEPRSVLVNPFPPQLQLSGPLVSPVTQAVYVGLKQSADPGYVAPMILDAMLHELAHQRVQNEEGTAINEAVEQIIAAIGPEHLAALEEAIKREITGPGDALDKPYLAARAAYYAKAGTDRRPAPARSDARADRPGRADFQIINPGGRDQPGGDQPDGGGAALRSRTGPGHRTEVYELPHAGVEANFSGARLVPEPEWAFMQRWATQAKHNFQRVFPTLPMNDRRFAELYYKLLEIKKGRGIAAMQTALHLKQVLDELNPKDASFFGRMLWVLDMEQDVIRQTAAAVELLGVRATPELVERHILLPQGDGSDEQRMTPARVAEMAAVIKGEMELPENAAAVEAREIRLRLMEVAKDRYIASVEKATGHKLAMDREEYFHHQILDFAREQYESTPAGKLKAAGKRTFTMHREGSLLNYNTNFPQAENAWLSTMLYDTTVNECMAFIHDEFDIKPQVVKAATVVNDERMMAVYEEMAAAMNENRRGGKKEVTAEDLYRKLNAPIARGFYRIGMLAAESPDLLPGYDDGRWTETITQLGVNWNQAKEARESGNESPELTGDGIHRLWQYLTWLLQPPQAGQPGSGAAGMIFKGLAAKRAEIKRTLGPGQHVTWRDLLRFPVEGVDFTGYEAIQPAEGRHLYRAWTVQARIANALLAEGARDLKIPLSRDQMRWVTAVGGRKPEWVVPKEVAQTLKEFSNPMRTLDDQMIRKAGSLYKNWTLLVFPHWLSYQRRKTASEAERTLSAQLIAPWRWWVTTPEGKRDPIGNPYDQRYMQQSFKDFWQMYRHKGMPTEEMRGWMDRGGMLSSFSSMTTQPGQTLDLLRHLAEMPAGVKESTWDLAWRRGRLTSNMRDEIIRYASYLAYRDQMLRNKAAGGLGRPLNWGASHRDMVMALPDILDRAYVLSNELMGAYDQVPAGFAKIRDKLPMPWFAFKVTNDRANWRIASNQWAGQGNYEEIAVKAIEKMDEVGTSGGAGGGGRLPPTGGGGSGGGNQEPEEPEDKAARDLWNRLKRTQGTRGALKALRITPSMLFWLGRMVASMYYIQAMIVAYNWTMHPDEEKALPPHVRWSPHFDLGRIAGTKLYGYWDNNSAFGETAPWASIDNLHGYWDQLRDGRITLGGVFLDLVKFQVNMMIGEIGLPRLLYELQTGRQGFPDAFNTRAIRDRWQYLADAAQMGNVYKALWRGRGLPQPGGRGALAAQIAGGVKIFDPAEAQYDESRELALTFGEAHGMPKPQESDTDKANNAYWVKRSWKVGDRDGSLYFLARYWAAGGNDRGWHDSLKTLYPLDRWNGTVKSQFLLGLKSQEAERYRAGLWYLQQTVAPDLHLDPGEVARLNRAPIEEFDDGLKNLIFGVIDSRQDFGGYEVSQPAAVRAERKATLALQGKPE